MTLSTGRWTTEEAAMDKNSGKDMQEARRKYLDAFDKPCQHAGPDGRQCGQHRRQHGPFAATEGRAQGHAFEYDPRNDPTSPDWAG